MKLCKNGHQLTKQNTRIDTKGFTICKACKQVSQKLVRDREREANRMALVRVKQMSDWERGVDLR